MTNIIKKYEKMNNEQLDKLFKSIDERTDIDWPYIAGWIDGDGFIGKIGPRCYGISLKINDKEPVEMLSEIFKTSLSQEKMDKRPIFINPPKRRYYTNIRGKKVLYLAKKIAPFIMEKTKNLYKTLESLGCNEKFSYMEHNDKDFISYLIGFTEAEGSFSVTKKKQYIYQLANTNYNLIKYLHKRLHEIGFFNFKIYKIGKEGYYFFNKKVTDKVVYRKNVYRLFMGGYSLLDFYNLIYSRMKIDRKKQRVSDAINYYKNYKGPGYNNYMRDKLAL
jgi:hypothetical protein